MIMAAVGTLLGGVAGATQFNTGNPDLEIRWDNTVKYNLGVRVEERERTLGDTWALQAGEYKFDKGDIVTNRLDLLTEFDLVYKKSAGFRISAAAWYDNAYDSNVTGNPAYQAAGFGTAYPGNKFPNTIKRYYTKSGELLDAFIFGRIDAGEVPISVKLGRHNIYWGESLFSPIHGASYSQGPVDFRKAVATPGSEAKELFLPLNQLSAHAQLSESVSVAAQYGLEWKPYRIYEGGTYFTFTDLVFQGGTSYLGLPYNGDLESGTDRVPRDRGSWGINLKATPEWLNGTVGVYYRRFDDKVPGVLGTYSATGALTELHNVYAQDVKLAGISVSKQIAGVAIGAELVHRKNTALTTVFGAPGMARGDSWHALANAIAYIGKTPVFDSAVLLAEVTYSRLDKVYGSTAAWFSSVDHTCVNAIGGLGGSKRDGCATKDAWGLAVTFTPTWFQALPSVDLSMPIHYDRGLKGNSPVPFGGNENSGTWSIGLGADYQAKYKFDLAYTDYFGNYTAAANPFFGVPGIGATHMGSTNGGNALIRDRGWLSFTFKTSF
jgi:hypothetical protein